MAALVRAAGGRPQAWPALVMLALLACSGEPASEQHEVETQAFACLEPTKLSFTADPGDADEAYVCFGFDATAPTRAELGGIVWSPPDAASATLLHHATLYAVPMDFGDGPVPCDGMPAGAVGLHVWSPGGNNLELPADTALVIPPATQRFVVEAHVRRVQTGAARKASVSLCGASSTVAHHAAFLGYSAPVPALRPMHDEETDGACQLPSDAHLWSVWPHMHLAGREIAVSMLSASGESRTLVDVDPWSFHQQRTYRVSVDAEAGDTLQTHCRWHNDTGSYIFGGPRTEDEMCNTGLIVWPAEAAACR